ncbi:hypothetical protein A2630_04655 [Candidatus Woesebacteria bacterium RIFCSPHIGHO2_01_FULL_44_10]|uniref:Glycosyl transferase family 1 domain-containing protein n=1 Tax=Candidatus Woesebacteria bacterium RIFCSPLOWO2_01_FULL_44_14 TaxID=1802525 RepID=A0A1F8C4H0_9BACT|nr:MAG: hypothetical protein A2630_04655 [Candidatus Woesebacteria bacterium RIFCSPHIGHO2_01_FULL_44_10]OGM56046.1 MAG: hypothetical protein A3F62_03960 [Candidatus Woesebacteria bacterium RIFCSPHIGHO2_12_FULL_44_11]OGM70769.1 MAG: hypothetical protein A2975_02670 [Candidatus Woesebacteria bacterium RIFCSPLOWO2_01_FULL_44_14]
MEKKLKIAFLSFFSGEIERGVEVYVHELANHLADFGHEVLVIQNGLKVEGSKYKTISIGMKIWGGLGSYGPATWPYYHFLNGVFTLRALKFIKEDLDVVFPTNNMLQSLFIKIWSMKNKVKFVISAQSGLGLDDRINAWLFPDAFVALTGFQERWIQRNNSKIKTIVIPNGVNVSEFGLQVKPYKHNLPGKVILNVAALTFWKRQELAIKAVSRLKDISLLLVGQGEDKEKLERLGKRFLPGRFKIISSRHDEMPSIYTSADVFTFPTASWESFGIVLIEAMASGLPVVAADDPIRREIVGDAGLFVDPTDTKAYAAALQKALDANWGDKPRRQAEKFDWDKIALKYEKLFLELCSKR